MKWYILLCMLIVSCGQNKTETIKTELLPEITAETETTIEVWGWNVAAKGLESIVPSFNKKYPNITVNVTEFGGTGAILERAIVVLNSGTGLPDILQAESDFVQTYAETYPQRFLDMTPYVDEGWEKTMDPSKVPVSYDTENRLVSIPWDSGPVVLFYRDDYFKQAGIDPDSIKTWDDYIVAGKKIQQVLPEVKMTGFGYTADDGPWRILMTQAETYYLNTNDQITINSPEALESLKLLKTMVDQGLVKDTVNWTGLIQSLKEGSVATFSMGGWWAGTMKDQAPELTNVWRVMKIPTRVGGSIRASSQGGSTLMITSPDPIKQMASMEFLKHALFTVDAQYTMFNKYGLFPSYMPVYSDPRFLQGDPYFGGQNINQILGEVVTEIPPVIYNSAQYAEIRNIAIAAFERAINSQDDIEIILNDTAQQIQSATEKSIAP